MRFEIETEEKEKCLEVIKEFAKEFKEEYQKEISKLRYAPLKPFLPLLEPFVFIDEEKVIFALPLKPPEFSILRSMIQKLTGRIQEPKWNEKLVRMLEGYLKAKGVKFERVIYAEGENY